MEERQRDSRPYSDDARLKGADCNGLHEHGRAVNNG